ncbi:hypothetical protein BDP55DRAFT_65742 [Colletotrichum godetiae]|uniref:Uncharacterized protein n=1 Tax=Colletotrichum godetiae TaxID=1209918 RepID=A0AAJ0F0A6_9PEZI|nr:uncharacterized protein BDP55DRAFT_65742 [Colletotrichum godetiae]KAK1688333.1 hypothetical protein BDP55DRAFT_65742 [Colletotrichum godetiae]
MSGRGRATRYITMFSSPFRTTNLFLIFSYTRAIATLWTPYLTGRARRRERCWTSKMLTLDLTNKRINRAPPPFSVLSTVSISGPPLSAISRRNPAALIRVAKHRLGKGHDEMNRGSKGMCRIPFAR